MRTAFRVIAASALLVLAVVAAGFGYRVARADLAADVYRARLEALAADYETLHTQYNAAVRKAAVNELVIRGGRLSIRTRTSAGVVSEIETPFDPAGEIYVDYVVLDGRLWIRRVFDASTPPSEGLLLDDQLAHVDWESPEVTYGKAVYRRLDEGRWVVTVTGTGSLGLRRLEGEESIDIASAPPVHDYDAIEDELETRVASIGLKDVWGRLTGGQ